SIKTPHGLSHAPSMLAISSGSKIFADVHQILLVQIEPVLRILSVPNHGPVACREFCGVVVCPWTEHVCCDLGGGRVVIGQTPPRGEHILFKDIFFGTPGGKVPDQVMEAIHVPHHLFEQASTDEFLQYVVGVVRRQPQESRSTPQVDAATDHGAKKKENPALLRSERLERKVDHRLDALTVDLQLSKFTISFPKPSGNMGEGPRGPTQHTPCNDTERQGKTFTNTDDLFDLIEFFRHPLFPENTGKEFDRGLLIKFS